MCFSTFVFSVIFMAFHLIGFDLMVLNLFRQPRCFIEGVFLNSYHRQLDANLSRSHIRSRFPNDRRDYSYFNEKCFSHRMFNLNCSKCICACYYHHIQHFKSIKNVKNNIEINIGIQYSKICSSSLTSVAFHIRLNCSICDLKTAIASVTQWRWRRRWKSNEDIEVMICMLCSCYDLIAFEWCCI